MKFLSFSDLRTAIAVLVLCCAAAAAQERAPATRPGGDVLPKSADLRKQFEAYGLNPRPQGARGTCSVFTTVSALEFGLANVWGRVKPPACLSVEFLNWASNQVAGDEHDGSFFADCLSGFRKYGICREDMMRYQPAFDPARQPSADALKEAATLLPGIAHSFEVHWILPPGNEEPGLTDRQLTEVKSTLARGYPVAFGSGHSVLLVGFEDDAKKPGGGEFLTKDSAANAFRTYSYEFVRTKPYDVFWVEFFEKPRTGMKRTSWAYRTGTFTQGDDGKWTEVGDAGGRFSFQEVSRNDDYVELFSPDRHLTLRIYGETRSRLFYKTPKLRSWAVMYDGKWRE